MRSKCSPTQPVTNLRARARFPVRVTAGLRVRAGELGPHLGPVLLQIPRTLTANSELIRTIRPFLEGIRVAFEPRHGSWFEDSECLASLTEFGWALVSHPNSVGRATVGNQSGGRDELCERYKLEPLHHQLTTNWVYARLHGDVSSTRL
eukprot:TRINITY_DN6471_c0_g1_i3.p1 TRINITY_DN6471_c0_g1~~TRINITY_DN6471_c0_g1_i3.p1  ORF type:complete len:149 (-),score=11.62 TRINITY_DN6471_c0_g1_i3:600-1046(-)